MMEYISHRVNTIEALKNTPSDWGVELDIRDDLEGDLYLEHDPFTLGESFEEYLKEYMHGTMILNIKSERVELRVQELLKKYNIQKYFFLDSSFPMIKLLSDQDEKNIALRYSEYEGMDTLEKMQGKVEWVWVDCFSYLPLNKEVYQKLKKMEYKICLVSPELQGQSEKIEEYVNQVIGMEIDAVCTKAYNVEKWTRCRADIFGVKN